MTGRNSDEERAIREANSVFRDEWDNEEASSDFWTLLAVVLFAAFLIAAQSC